jgi:hypothetical protein
MTCLTRKGTKTPRSTKRVLPAITAAGALFVYEKKRKWSGTTVDYGHSPLDSKYLTPVTA